MLKTTMSVLAALALFGGALTSQEANAGQTSPVPVQEQSLTDASGFGQALSAENLGGQSGGSYTTQVDELNAFFNNATINASNSGNSISGSTSTGLNEISEGAFAKMNGFATVIQNTGNQVLINTQLIVNVVAN
jgi:hypothetical protein